MKTIKLNGEPASLFCREIKLTAESFSDVYEGINVNYPKFRSYVIDKSKNGLSFYFTDKENNIVTQESFKLNEGVYSMHLHVVGAGGDGVSMLAQGGLGFIQGFGMSMLSNWLNKKMNPKKPDKVEISTESYIYTQNENLAQQGTTLPVGYGQLRIGSKVISSSITNYDFDFDRDFIYPNPTEYDKFFDTKSFIDLKQNSNEIIKPFDIADVSKGLLSNLIGRPANVKNANLAYNNYSTNQNHNSDGKAYVSERAVYGPGQSERSTQADAQDRSLRIRSKLLPDIGDFDQNFRPTESSADLVKKYDGVTETPLSVDSRGSPRRVGNRPNWSKLESISIFRSTEILSEGPIEGLALPITGSSIDNGTVTYPENTLSSAIASSSNRAELASLKANLNGELTYNNLTTMTVANGGILSSGQDFSTNPSDPDYPQITAEGPSNLLETNIGSHFFSSAYTGRHTFRNGINNDNITGAFYLSGSADDPMFVLLEDEGSFRFSPSTSFQTNYGLPYTNGSLRKANFKEMVKDDESVFKLSLSQGNNYPNTSSAGILKEVSPIKESAELKYLLNTQRSYQSYQAVVFDGGRTTNNDGSRSITRLRGLKDMAVPEAGLTWAEMLRVYPDMGLTAGQLSATKTIKVGEVNRTGFGVWNDDLRITVSLQNIIDGTYNGVAFRCDSGSTTPNGFGNFTGTFLNPVFSDYTTVSSTMSRLLISALLALGYSGAVTRKAVKDISCGVGPPPCSNRTKTETTLLYGPGTGGTALGFESRFDFSGNNNLDSIKILEDGVISKIGADSIEGESSLRGDYYPGIFPRVTIYVIRDSTIKGGVEMAMPKVLPTSIEAVAKVSKFGKIEGLILLKNPDFPVYDSSVKKGTDDSTAWTPIQPLDQEDPRVIDDYSLNGEANGSKYTYQDCGFIAVIDKSFDELKTTFHKDMSGELYEPELASFDNFVKVRESWDDHVSQVNSSPGTNNGGAGFFNILGTYPSAGIPSDAEKQQTFNIDSDDPAISSPTTKGQIKITTEEIDLSTGYKVTSINSDWNSGVACSKILTGRPIKVELINPGAGYLGGSSTFIQNFVSKNRQGITRVEVLSGGKGYKPNNSFYIYPVSSEATTPLLPAEWYKCHAARLKVTTNPLGSIKEVEVLQHGYGFSESLESDDVILITDAGARGSAESNGTIGTDDMNTQGELTGNSDWGNLDADPKFWGNTAANSNLKLALNNYDSTNRTFDTLEIVEVGKGFTSLDIIDNPFQGTVSFTGPTFVPTIINGSLSSVEITNGGSGYSDGVDDNVPVSVNFVLSAVPEVNDPISDEFAWARSIYLNDVPIRDKNGYFNFSKFDFDLMVGHYKAKNIKHKVELNSSKLWDRQLIKEEYRYPMQTEIIDYPLIGPRNQNDKEYYFSYAVKNPNVDSVVVSIKMGKLFYVYEGDKEIVHVNLIPMLTAIVGYMLGKALTDMIADILIPSATLTTGSGMTSPVACPGAPLTASTSSQGFSQNVAGAIKGLVKGLIGMVGGMMGAVMGYFLGELVPCSWAPFLCFKIGEVIENSGELWPATCKFKIEYGTEGSHDTKTEELTIQGVATQPYVKDFLINLPSPNSFNNNYVNRIIKIYRITREMDPVRNGLSDSRFQIIPSIHGVTEIVDGEFSYPNTSYIGLRTNSKDFSSPPKREYLLKLKKVKIPSNYDPTGLILSSFYNGNWTGGFKQSNGGDGLFWTSNPAWIIYDIITDNVFGMGKYGIREDDVDKWSFYKFSQRCDEMVDVTIDGVSTTERRHMCNLYIENSADAYEFLSRLLKIYSANLSWSSGKLAIVQDAPANEGPVMMFTNTNVSEEGFSYASTPQSSRYTACTVAYVDERDNYRPKVEYVEDIAGIKKYGYKKIEIAGIGVTRKGEAHRLAWQNILSHQMESEVVQFQAGLEASYLRPGDVIQIVDNHKIEKRSGGRISKIKSSNTIEIDMPVSILPAAGSYLILEKPTSSDDPSDILNSSEIANRRSPQYVEYEIQSKTGFEVVFTSNLDPAIVAGYNWIIKENSADKIKPKYYKIESMSEVSTLSFDIQASEYFDEKYEFVDASTSSRNGINITERAYSGHSIDTASLGGLTI